MLFRHLVLLFAGRAVDHRDAVVFRPGPQAPAESARHAHEVVIVEILIRPEQLTPPHAQAAAGLAHSKICVQDHAVDAIVTAFEKIAVENTQLVRHDLRSVTLFPKSPQLPPKLPAGASFSGRSPRKRVVTS